MKRNFIVNGGPTSGARGAQTNFGPLADLDVNGIFTINGGAANTAEGAFVIFSVSGNLGLNGSFLINGGTASGATGPTVTFAAATSEINGSITTTGGTTSGEVAVCVPAVPFRPRVFRSNGLLTRATGSSGLCWPSIH